MPRNKSLSIFDSARNDYLAGKNNSRYVPRLTGVSPTGSGHSYHIRTEREWLNMMERSRDLMRNDIVVGAAVRRLISNVVQQGFTLDPDTGDVGLDEDLKGRFNDWGNNPDACHSEAEHDFRTIEKLTLMSVIRDGDIFHLPLKSGQLQCVEAHRVRTPSNTRQNVVHGIKLSKRAKRLEYWITKENLGTHSSLKLVKDVQQYGARDESGNRQVFHVYLPQRFSQRRGITALAPVSGLAAMHDDIQFATLVKQQTSALIALFREQTMGSDDLPIGMQFGPVEETTLTDGSIREIQGLSAGLDITGRPGEKLQGFSPNIPSASYFEHVMMILKFIGANLDLPAAVLLLDPSQSNFSSWRGSIDQARLRFREIQSDLIRMFHRPVFEWKVRQWLNKDASLRRLQERDGINVFGHAWHPPTWQYIDPQRDSQADNLQLSSLLSSPRRIQASRGRDFNQVAREIVEDNNLLLRMALTAAKGIKQEFPEADITWRDLLSLSQTDRLTQFAVSEDIPDGNNSAQT